MKTKVLFLCTGNSCRSQMAEALLRHHAGDKFEVFSAGLAPRPVNPLTVTVMDEIGLDIRGQRSKSLKEFMGKVPVDFAIFVCARAEKSCPSVYPFTLTALLWPFDDPAEEAGTDDNKLRKFREVRDQIDRKINAWLATVLPAYTALVTAIQPGRSSSSVIGLYETAACIPNDATPEARMARLSLLAFLSVLNCNEFRTERFLLEQHPTAFEQNPAVTRAIRDQGTLSLPLLLLDGRVICEKRYPGIEEFSDLIKFGCRDVPANSACCRISNKGPEDTTTTKREE